MNMLVKKQTQIKGVVSLVQYILTFKPKLES